MSAPEPMRSVYEDELPSPTDHRRRAELWNQDRQQVADRWFAGDVERALSAFDALPYSAIPEWTDLDRVMLAAAGYATEAPEPVEPMHPGDEVATVQEFIAWLMSSSGDIRFYHPGRGHNETASPARPETIAALALRFALREDRS